MQKTGEMPICRKFANIKLFWLNILSTLDIQINIIDKIPQVNHSCALWGEVWLSNNMHACIVEGEYDDIN